MILNNDITNDRQIADSIIQKLLQSKGEHKNMAKMINKANKRIDGDKEDGVFGHASSFKVIPNVRVLKLGIWRNNVEIKEKKLQQMKKTWKQL